MQTSHDDVETLILGQSCTVIQVELCVIDDDDLFVECARPSITSKAVAKLFLVLVTSSL